MRLRLFIVVVLSIYCSMGNTASIFEKATNYWSKDEYISLATIIANDDVIKVALKTPANSSSIGLNLIVQSYNNISMDLIRIKTDDTDIQYIRDEAIEGLKTMLTSLRTMQTLTPPDSKISEFILGATSIGFGLHTGHVPSVLGGAAGVVRFFDNQEDPIQREFLNYLVGIGRFKDATSQLPRAAQKFASNPEELDTNEISIDITEPWGTSQPTSVILTNNTSDDFRNCTFTIAMSDKKGGDAIENVFFVEEWLEDGAIDKHFGKGIQLNEKTIGKTTVDNIDYVNVLFYCDDLSTEDMQYKYTDDERLKDVKNSVAHFKLTNIKYEPFVDGGWGNDQEMSLSYKFEGLEFLPPHILEVVLDNDESNSKRIDVYPLQRHFQIYSSSNRIIIDFEKEFTYQSKDLKIVFYFLDPKFSRTFTCSMPNTTADCS